MSAEWRDQDRHAVAQETAFWTLDANGNGAAQLSAAFLNAVFQAAAANYQTNQNQDVWFHRPGLYLNVFADDATYRNYEFGCAAGAIGAQWSNWNFGGSLSDLVEQLKLGWWPGLPALTNVAAQAHLSDPLTVQCAYPAAPTPNKVIIFVTAATSTGALGGVSGADAKCQTDANAATLPGGKAGYTIKALLSATGYNAKDVLPASKQTATVYRVDGTTPIAANWAALWNAGTTPLTNSVSSASLSTWTGTQDDGTTDTETCNDWTNGTGSSTGVSSATDAKDGWWLNRGSGSCIPTVVSLYCVAY